MTDMNDLQDREELLRKDVLLVATAALSLVNGMHFSPWFDLVAILLKPFVAGTFLASPLVFLYLTSIFISACTLIIAGVPAAIYERIRDEKTSSSISLGIWLAATALLTAPSFISAAGG